MEQFKPLRGDLHIKLSGASDVATRSAETNDQAEAHRIAGSRKHNGNGRAYRPSGQRSGRTERVQVVVATPREGCDEEVETTIGPFWSGGLTVTGATDNCESRTDEEVLGSNFCRFGERRGCGDRGRTTSGRGTVVQKGRWHATSDVRAVCTAAFRQIFVTS